MDVRTPSPPSRLLLWALLAALAGASVLSGCSSTSPDAVADTDGVDPVLVDYVAPLTGDALAAAQARFDVELAEAASPSIADCVRERGYPDIEDAFVERARDTASGVLVNFPSVSRIEAGALNGAVVEDRLSPEADAAMTRCSDEVDTASAEWLRRADDLQYPFLETVVATVAELEAEPVWAEAERCFSDAGAPPDPGEGEVEGFAAYLMWASGESMARAEAEDAIGSSEPSPEAQAFVDCTEPFFAEVAEALEEPRADFVEEHGETLAELQREYEAFSGSSG